MPEIGERETTMSRATRLLEKADAALVARNLEQWAAVPWTDPTSGMGKRRDLCGLLVPASRIVVRASGTPVRTSRRDVRMTYAERRPIQWDGEPPVGRPQKKTPARPYCGCQHPKCRARGFSGLVCRPVTE
jgi:hypothetical protein